MMADDLARLRQATLDSLERSLCLPMLLNPTTVLDLLDRLAAAESAVAAAVAAERAVADLVNAASHAETMLGQLLAGDRPAQEDRWLVETIRSKLADAIRSRATAGRGEGSQ